MKRIIDEIREWYREHLGGKLVVLSLSGSRGYGWATDIFDYDIWGLFDGIDWMDYIHSQSIKGVDLNLQSLEHFEHRVLDYHSLEDLINMSNPIYSDGFDVMVFWRRLPLDAFKPAYYRQEFRGVSPRSVLYAFRSILIPLYFLETGRVKINCFEIAEELGVKVEAFHLARDWYLSYYGEAPTPKVHPEEIYRRAIAECAELERRYVKALDRWRSATKSLQPSIRQQSP